MMDKIMIEGYGKVNLKRYSTVSLTNLTKKDGTTTHSMAFTDLFQRSVAHEFAAEEAAMRVVERLREGGHQVRINNYVSRVV